MLGAVKLEKRKEINCSRTTLEMKWLEEGIRRGRPVFGDKAQPVVCHYVEKEDGPTPTVSSFSSFLSHTAARRIGLSNVSISHFCEQIQLSFCTCINCV